MAIKRYYIPWFCEVSADLFSGYSLNVNNVDESDNEKNGEIKEEYQGKEEEKGNNKENEEEEKQVKVKDDKKNNIISGNSIIETEKNEIIEETSMIKLGNPINNTLKAEQIKREGYVIYESKSEKIKKYAVYFFALQCVILAILIGFKRIS